MKMASGGFLKRSNTDGVCLSNSRRISKTIVANYQHIIGFGGFPLVVGTVCDTISNSVNNYL
jgi:hypothetical protein